MRLAVRRVLIYTHRWLGICGCVLFISWFASGVVMMYARMPQLSSEERLARLAPLDLAAARVGIADVARGLVVDRIRVSMLAGRPVYRLLTSGTWTDVFADTGSPVGTITRDQAIDLARLWAPEHASTIRYDAYLTDADQWTLGGNVRRRMPMHRIALGDLADSRIYISERGGEVVMKTAARDRRWAYAGAVLHWIYFTPLRRLTAAWAQLIIWLSIAGCVMCLSGLVWGVWRYSPASRYRLKRERSHSPYAGLMRWHHYAGLFFGAVSFTWIFSGLLSMDPWNWSPSTAPTRQEREAVAGGPMRIATLTLPRLRRQLDEARLKPRAPGPGTRSDGPQSDGSRGVGRAIRELEIAQFSGEPFVITRDSPVRFDRDRLLAAARAAIPHATVDEATWLEDYDAYYYDRDRELALPVLRVRFADTARTWLYLDARRGAIVRKEERLSRLNRWLYHGLHSLDLPFLYYRRPLWDIVVIALSLGGLVLSATTVSVAAHRLRRHARRRAMRRAVTFGLAVGATAALAAAADTIPASGGNIEVTPLAHATVQVEHGGKVILVDPAPPADVSKAKQADLVLITDIHPDHLDAASLGKVRKSGAPVVIPAAAKNQVSNGTVIGNGETKTVAGLSIEAVPMYNLRRGPAAGQLFHDKGRGNGYIVTLGGKRLYFAGDTECTPEMKALKNIDVAFVPMNLPYTMTPAEAAECVKAFKPKIVYPYHFRGQKPEDFAAALKGESIDVRIRDWYPAAPAR